MRDGHIAYVAKAPNAGYDPFLYNTDLSSNDVELSEDLFILTSAEAEKHKEPPQLTRLVISPEQAWINPGMKQAFTVEALDQFGRPIQTENLEWTSTGGTLDADGIFTAGPDLGNFNVTVRAEEKLGTAGVAIVAKDKTPPPPPAPKGPKSLTWTGEVAPQKWSNLYMKVLTKFVQTGNIKIRVSIEAPLKEDMADQQVEETRAALRGLGLDDNVEIE